MRLPNLKSIKQNDLFLVFAISIYIILFSYLSCKRYWAGFANEWEDIAWVNNLYWNMLHGNWDYFYKNYIDGTLVDFHPSVAILVFPFLYALLPNIYFVILTPTVFIAITAWPLYKIAKLVWKDELSAMIIAIAYLFYAPKHSIAFVEDQTLFIIPILAFSVYVALQEKFMLFFALNFLIATAKTESVVYSILLTSYFLLIHRNTDKYKQLLKQFIFFLLWAVVYLFLELRANAGNYMQTGERELNLKNIYEMVVLLIPLLFFPVRSSLVFLTLPGIALLITKRFFLPQQAYYLAPAIVFLFISYIIVLNRFFDVRGKYFRLILNACLGLCILSNFMPNLIGSYLSVTDQPYKKITNHKEYLYNHYGFNYECKCKH